MMKKTIHILSVEDNDGDFILIKEILKESFEFDYILENCASIYQAIEKLKNFNYDLALLDLSLPDSRGLGTLYKLFEASSSIPVIVITGHDDLDLAKSAIKAGAQDFLVKGNFDNSLISRAIAYAIERKEMDKKLRGSEKLYRDLIELSTDAILIHRFGSIVYANPASVKLLGVKDIETLLGRSILSFIKPAYHDSVKERMQRSHDGEMVGLMEEVFVRADGAEINVEVVANPILYMGQAAVQVVIRDITEKNRAIEATKRLSELNAQMAELAGNLLKARDFEGITSFTLEKAKQLTKSEFGFVGYIDPKSGFLVVPTLSQEIWQECRVEKKDIIFKKFTGLWGWTLIHKKSLMSNRPEKDYRSTGTPEGHVAIKRIISVPAMHDQRLVGIITLANSECNYTEQDLTVAERLASVFALGVRRIQAVNEVVENQEKFRLAFQYSNIGSIIVGLNKRLLRVNSTFSQMLGYTEEEMLSKSFDDVTHPDDIEIGRSEYFEMLEGKTDFSANQKRYIHKDGHIIRAYVSSTILRNQKNEPLYFITHVQDFTQKLEAEEKLLASLEEKETLIRELYHRTKNNMQVICSMIELKLLAISDTETINVFREIENRIKTMALVHEKLYQSQNLSKIDLKDYLNDLVMMLFMRYGISSNKIDLILELESITVLIDTAIPCGLFLTEMLSNSFKYAFPGDMTGKVNVSLKRLEGEFIELKISDDGIGIKEGVKLEGNNSIGFKLIYSIAESQLQGSVKCSTNNGVSCSVVFKDIFYSERV
jgi:PAS domain S-box-containing protein